MRVTWLCSRKVEGQVFGYYTKRQIESDKDRIMNELLGSIHQMSKWNAECLEKGSMTSFGTMFYYSGPACRQDHCNKTLSQKKSCYLSLNIQHSILTSGVLNPAIRSLSCPYLIQSAFSYNIQKLVLPLYGCRAMLLSYCCSSLSFSSSCHFIIFCDRFR